VWFAITENWFKPPMEVIDQGGTLSPTLFAVFVNDLVEEINSLSCGVTVGGRTIAILVYADDIALISDNETDLQKMLDVLDEWYRRLRVIMNTSK